MFFLVEKDLTRN